MNTILTLDRGSTSADSDAGTSIRAGERDTRAADGGGKRARDDAGGSDEAASPAGLAAPAPDDELSAQPRNDQTWKKVARTTERSIESSGRAKRKAAADAMGRPHKEARAPAGREKRKATAEATERSHKEARASETAKAKRDTKRKRASETAGPVLYVDNGKGGDRSILRTVTVSSLMVDRVVGDQYEWRDRSYRETNGRCGQIFDDGG